MGSVKTAISLQETLLAEADAAARDLNTTRSGVIALALGEFLRRRRAEELRARIDAALADDDQAEELATARTVTHHRGKRLPADW
jgi:metal-responsive CopG/Arc/MetJ family transcriptional regulator